MTDPNDHDCLVARAGAHLMQHYGPAALPIACSMGIVPSLHDRIEVALQVVTQEGMDLTEPLSEKGAHMVLMLVSGAMAQHVASLEGHCDELVSTMLDMAGALDPSLRESLESTLASGSQGDVRVNARGGDA